LAKLSCKTICIGVCIGCILLLAVAVPLTIFVIMPAMAQQAVNWTVLTITNSTMLPCLTQHVQLINQLSLHSSSIFSATVHPFNMTLSTYVCDGGHPGTMCDNSTETVMGTYWSPEMHMSKGTNVMAQTVNLYVSNKNVLLTAFTLPLISTPIKPALLSVYSNDVSVSVFGIKLSKLKLRYDMTCDSIGISTASPDPKICGSSADTSQGHSSAHRRLQGGFGPEMICKPGLTKKTTLTIFA
jgi:hypothetical protein